MVSYSHRRGDIINKHINRKIFEKEVLDIFTDCFVSRGNEKSDDTLVGEARTERFSYIFDLDKVKEHISDIYVLLYSIKDIENGIKYNDFNKLKQEGNWTELNMYKDMLLSLGRAVKLIDMEKETPAPTKQYMANPKIKLINLKDMPIIR